MSKLLQKLMILALFIVTADGFHAVVNNAPRYWWETFVLAFPLLTIIGIILTLVSFVADWLIKGRFQYLYSCLLYSLTTLSVMFFLLYPNGVTKFKDILWLSFFGVIYGVISELVKRKIMGKREALVSQGEI